MDEYIYKYDELIKKTYIGLLDGPGQIELFGWKIDYVNGNTLPNFIDQLLVRKLNDFVTNNEAPLILDCGANIGLSVLHYKNLFPKSRIIAFEPDPLFAPALKQNVHQNNLADTKVIEAAVWSQNGTMPWISEGADGSRIIENYKDDSEAISVRTIDLKEYLDQEIDLLKLDIEGAEYAVVKHISNSLGMVKNIIVECHINQSTLVPFGDLLKILASAGFEVYFNTFGTWRDLIRRPPVHGLHWEQYVVVVGHRGNTPNAVQESSDAPYLGAYRLFEVQDLKAQLDKIRKEYESLLPSNDILRRLFLWLIKKL